MDNKIKKQQIPQQHYFCKPKTKAYLATISKLENDFYNQFLRMRKEATLSKDEKDFKEKISKLKSKKISLKKRKANLKMKIYSVKKFNESYKKVDDVIDEEGEDLEEKDSEEEDLEEEEEEDSEEEKEFSTQFLLEYVNVMLEDKQQKKMKSKNILLFKKFRKVCRSLQSIKTKLTTLLELPKPKVEDDLIRFLYSDSSMTNTEKSQENVPNPGQINLDQPINQDNIHGVSLGNTSNTNTQIVDQQQPTNNNL